MAKRLFAVGMERGTPTLCNVKEWMKRTDRHLADARKDNDFIYHERIPEERALASVGKAVVAKAMPFESGSKLGNPTAPELFDKLVPVAVHQALVSYDLRRSELVNKELAKVKDATTMINELLSSMNLPASLEETKGALF